MEVQIQRLQSTVQAFDGDVPLSPQTMDKIVRAVLEAVNDREAHRSASAPSSGSPAASATNSKRGSKRRWNRLPRRRCWSNGSSRRRNVKNPEQIEVQYNPTELSWDKSAQFAEIAIPGLDAPLQQFVRGQAEKLTLELFFDTTDHGMGKGAAERHHADGPDLSADQDRAHAPCPADLHFHLERPISRQLAGRQCRQCGQRDRRCAGSGGGSGSFSHRRSGQRGGERRGGNRRRSERQSAAQRLQVHCRKRQAEIHTLQSRRHSVAGDLDRGVARIQNPRRATQAI